MQLLFTQLLRKTSVIDSIKVKGQSRVARAQRSGPILLDFLLVFFSPRGEILKRNPAKEQRGRGSGSTIPYPLPTGRWMNCREINPEQTPYSDAHACAPSNPDTSERVYHPERSRCINFSPHLVPTYINSLLTRNALSYMHSDE
jgi:hypothetical protein